MKTGRDAVHSGLYMSDCCLRKITVVKDQMLPRCHGCLELTVWELITQEQGEELLIRKPDSAWIEESTDLFPKEYQSFPRDLVQ